MPAPRPLTSEASLTRLGWPEGPWLEVRGAMLLLLLPELLLVLLRPAPPASVQRLEDLVDLQT